MVATIAAPFACLNGAPPCLTPRADSTHALIAELARTARARVVPFGRDAVPPCPWGYSPPRPDAGYVVRVASKRMTLITRSEGTRGARGAPGE